MAGPHRINLSSAWCPPQEAFAGGVWVRRFGRPAGLGQGEIVWLVIESPQGCGAALNGTALPHVDPGQTFRHEITALLETRNELQLDPVAVPTREPTQPAARGPLPTGVANVRLEIEPGRPNRAEPA